MPRDAVTSAHRSLQVQRGGADAIYEFVWGIFCDWYLELIKPVLASGDEAAKAETRATAAWVLDQILKLLHPFMPFITEELWAHMVEHGVRRENLLCSQPVADAVGAALMPRRRRKSAGSSRLISEIRSVRTEMNVPAGAKIPLVLVGASAAMRERAPTQRGDDQAAWPGSRHHVPPRWRPRVRR